MRKCKKLCAWLMAVILCLQFSAGFGDAGTRVKAEGDSDTVTTEEPVTEVVPETDENEFITSESYDSEFGGYTLTITGFNGDDSSIAIPSSISGKKITKIDDKAFFDNETLTKVFI